MSYRVRWEIDIDADTPQEAAQKALAIQRDPQSIANVFDVFDESGQVERVDIQEMEETAAAQRGSETSLPKPRTGPSL
jgi:hypothetical protein